MPDVSKKNSAAVRITVRGGASCESWPGETVLSALARGGVALSAPCGGRGICGKCRVLLLEGKAARTDTARRNAAGTGEEVNPGHFFSACGTTALSDITVELVEGENGFAPELPRGAEGTQAGERAAGKKIRRAGVALDIGTTTVQAELADLDTGESLETVSALNAQRSFGADVMSRITAACDGKTGELYAAINRQAEDMLRYFIRAWNLSGIEHCAVSGNTVMLHLFSGVDPSGMGKVPFTPEFLDERCFGGTELSLSVDRVTLLPGISAFVGGDVVSGLAFLGALDRNEDSLFVDIGTNGEMALWKHAEKRLLCCSTAAGPCFEGAEISCGMGALPGAINRIRVGERADFGDARLFRFGPLAYTTLGNNFPPKGICGAALIDALAAMKRLAAIDETGALADDYAETGFPVAEGITVSQQDVRRFQLAKSAIRSGIDVLCEKAGLASPGDLAAVYIAGGLGFFIDPDNAVTAGLFPPEFAGAPGKNRTRISVCGNTSLKGAVKCLVDQSFLPRCREIIARSETVELSTDSGFIDAFAENMYF